MNAKRTTLLLLSLFVVLTTVTAISAASDDSAVATDNAQAVSVDTATSSDSASSDTGSSSSDVSTSSSSSDVSSSSSSDVSTSSSVQSSDTAKSTSSDTSSSSTSNVATKSVSTTKDNSVDTSKSVKTESTNVKSLATDDDEPTTDSDYVITDETYGDYFDDDGVLKAGTIADESTVTLQGDFNSKSFVFTDSNLKIVGDNAIVYGGTVKSTDTAKIDLSNVVINNTDSDLTSAIILESDGNIISSSSIYYNGTNEFKAITINGNENTVQNVSIVMEAYAGQVDWSSDPAVASTIAIGVFGDYNTITENYIEMYTSAVGEDYPTIDGITIQGTAYALSTEYALFNVVTYNTITIESDAEYIYSINLDANADNNTISYNKINAKGPEAVYGVQISNTPSYDNVISYNDITLDSDNFAYGITLGAWIADMVTVTVDNNNVTAKGDKVYLIEGYTGIYNSTISNNVLNGEGNYVSGITLSTAQNMVIDNNDITIVGTENGTFNDTYDTILPTTVGIQIDTSTNVSISATDALIDVVGGPGIRIASSSSVSVDGTAATSDNSDAMIINNSTDVTVTDVTATSPYYALTSDVSDITVTGSTFLSTDQDYAIKVNESTGSITENKIDSATNTGSKAIEVIDSDDMVIDDNYHIAVVSIESQEVANRSVTLTANVEDVDGVIVNEGYVIFKINGITIKDEEGNNVKVDVVDGVASLDYELPYTLSNVYTITTVYDGGDIYGVVRTEDATITVLAQNANIEMSIEGTAKAGETVTLKATVTNDDGTAVTTGKVAFKLNGKTLKDEEGNTIYGYVDENGVASIEYTIPSDYSAKDYTLTAVYGGTGYERAEAETTLTLEKVDTTIEIDDTTGSQDTITITQGENLNLKATIINTATDAPVVGTSKIAVKINGKTFANENVTDGVIDLTLDTADFKNPTYDITIIAGENNRYNEYIYNGTLVVSEVEE